MKKIDLKNRNVIIKKRITVGLMMLAMLICTSGFGQELYRFFQNSNYGLRDEAGHVIVPAKYDKIGDFSEGLAWVRAYYKWGFIDKTGNEVIPLIYEGVGDFYEGLARVKDEAYGKWGFIDKTGEKVIPLIYDDVEDFSEGLAKVGKGDPPKRVYGYIDKTGKEVIPLIYDEIGENIINKIGGRTEADFFEGLARVCANWKWGFIDKTGKEVIPLIYNQARHFSEGLANVEKDGKSGYIDKTGKIVLPLRQNYTEGSFSDGLAWMFSFYYGYMNKTRKIVIPSIYINARDFSEGLAGVKKYKKWGYINKTGEVVIPLIYDDIKDFSEGIAHVKLGEKWFYIDKAGEVLTYTDSKMKIIWENLLESCMTQINDYKSKLNYSSGNSGSFEINLPYLVVRTTNGKYEDIYFGEYSKGKFDKNSINDLKTIIVRYDYPAESARYNTNQGWKLGISYGAYLVYFDVVKKKCIGSDVIKSRDLPKNFVGDNSTWYVSSNDIINTIESRLASSPVATDDEK
jgi:hypothetical protein